MSPPRAGAPAVVLVAAVFLLFSVWALSFIGIERLVAGEGAAFDWLSLTIARFVPAGAICAAWCAIAAPKESLRIVRRHWARLAACGLLTVPAYCFALYYAQQNRVPAPIASLVTALAPLFVMLLSAGFLGERITGARAAGFAVALGGLLLVAASRNSDGRIPYPALVAVAALAPAAWSIHTVLTKTAVKDAPPLLWAYLVTAAGALPLVPLLPFAGGPEMLKAGLADHLWLAYLTLLCTVFGYAAWSWLLVHLPATSVGFTIFLNPPMTTGYKLLLAALFPAAFAFTVNGGELAGGAILLAGTALALLPRRPAAQRSAAESNRSR